MWTAIVIVVLAAVLAAAGIYIMLLRGRMQTQDTDFKAQRIKLERELRRLNTELESLRASYDSKCRQLDDEAERYTSLEATFNYKKALMLTLANVAYDALIVVDPDCKILATNEGAEQLFNEPSPLGKGLEDVTGVPELPMMVNDALINEEEEFEEQVGIGMGNYRVRTQVYRRDDYHFIGLALRDITQLIRLNRARRDMVANISHELRQPLANIRLTIDGLFHDQDKPKRKESIHSLRAIAKETDNLLWLVQEMSDLSMIESGQAIVRLIDHPLYEVVDEAFERMAERSEAANVNLVRHIPEKLRVLCDRDLIQRVFVNLIHNGLKWSPSGDAITIEATPGEEEVTISVLDNGPGVPPEAVDRIFERFYQVDSSRSGGEGTGLGLAICRHIVEAHGGRIWAESNADGSGGRFRFTLLNVGREEDVAADEALPATASTPEEQDETSTSD